MVSVKHLTDSVHMSLREKNWYGALALSLTLPDICARLINPGSRDRHGYIKWVTENLQPKYTSRVGADRTEVVFLSGKDCYALRCAMLHQGLDDVSSHNVREAVDHFLFYEPTPGLSIHRNQEGRALQLDVAEFCSDMCNAVDGWVSKARHDQSIAPRLANLMSIKRWGSDQSGVIAWL